MRRFTVLLAFLLILAACAAPANSALAPEIIIGEPSSDALIFNGTLETSLLATQWRGKSEGSILFPVDPGIGSALPGYSPISLGQTFFHAFSPDRQALAVVSFSDHHLYDGSLLLIDLSAWSARRFDLGLIGWVNTMVFSPDGKRLAIAHGQTDYKLTMVDIERGTITV